MNTTPDLAKLQELLKERARIEAALKPVEAEYAELKETTLAIGEKTSGAGWNLVVKLFEARTGMKSLRAEVIRINTEIRTNTYHGKFNLPQLWQLLVKLQGVTDLMEEGDPAYEEVHDIFDWAEEIYTASSSYFEAKDRAEAELAAEGETP